MDTGYVMGAHLANGIWWVDGPIYNDKLSQQ